MSSATSHLQWRIIVCVVAATLYFTVPPSMASETGDLDTKFNQNSTPGKLEFGAASDSDRVIGMLEYGGGAFVASLALPLGPGTPMVLIRYFGPDGSVDLSFASGGTYVAAATPDITIFFDGAAGGLAFVGDALVVTYPSGGDVYVEAFSDDGIFRASGSAAWDLITDGDDVPFDIADCSGKILVVGLSETGSASDAAIAVFNAPPNGARSTSIQLDTTFNASGMYTIGFNSPQPTSDLFSGVACADGKYLAAGTTHTDFSSREGVLARFTSSGGLDSTFDSDGIATYSPTIVRGSGLVPTRFSEVVVDPMNGEAYVAATISFNEDPVVVKVSSDGSLDSAFNGSGFSNPPSLSIGEDQVTFTNPVNILLFDRTVMLLGTAVVANGATNFKAAGAFYSAVDASTGSHDGDWRGNGVRVEQLSQDYASYDAVRLTGGSLLIGGTTSEFTNVDGQSQLLAVYGGLFRDGFESGDTSVWSFP